MTYTIPFQRLSKNDIPSAGGKGANLGEMTTAGFPVPGGFVLTTAAYDAFVGEHGLQQQIVALASTVSADNPQSSEKASEQIKRLFLGGEIPTDIAETLLGAYTEMNESAVAVRSSATAEDLPDASFAGQQETYLNVQDKGTLLEAVKHCWASLWTARAITYRIKQGIEPAEVSLAVVVQKQIGSEVSGVAFSLNPNNNDYDEAVINSNFGLGESIVSGQVTPDNFVVNKVTHQIIEKQLASKDYVLVSKAGGGMQETTLDDPKAASLTDAQVIALTKLVTQVESYYKLPMDIEWAYADGELYLLQARPITTYVPLPEIMMTEPGAEKYLYLDIIVLTQGFQDSLSVMGNEIWGKMIEAVKGDQGMFDAGMGGGVLNIEGRQYLHLSNLMKGLGMRVASSAIQSYDTPTRNIINALDLNDYMPAETPEPMRGLKWRTAKSIGRLIPSGISGLFNPHKAEEKYKSLFAKDVAMSKQLAVQEIPFSVLVEQLLDRFGQQMGTIMGVIGPAMLARTRLSRLFKKDDVDDLLVALQIDLNGNPTSEMGHLMFALTKFPAVQETTTGEEFARKLANKEFSAEFHKAYDDYMDRFGCRGIREIDIATERPYENVPGFFNQLKAMDIHSDMLAKVAQRRQDAYDKLLALATQKGKVKHFKNQVALQNNMGYREMPKYFFIVTLDLMRQRALHLGEQFVAQGRLDEAKQVFDLNVSQLTQAQRNSTLDLRAIIAENLAPRTKQAQVQNWPRIINSRGRIMRAKREPAKEGELVGDPIAPGVVRGIANVLHAPYEKPLNKGEILVTRATDPGWTPLFMNASGVVLEIGGALQHGAVIAREYGLPCVSGVESAVMNIPDGAMIEVDGSNGIVRLVEVA
ncbi:MAG: PEP/pyruvate-binding domain-containing protein [Ardenticatenaceae bacterium]